MAAVLITAAIAAFVFLIIGPHWSDNTGKTVAFFLTALTAILGVADFYYDSRRWIGLLSLVLVLWTSAALGATESADLFSRSGWLSALAVLLAIATLMFFAVTITVREWRAISARLARDQGLSQTQQADADANLTEKDDKSDV
jgi:hypothetical protein